MAGLLGDLFWRIRADTTDFEKGAKKTNKDAQGLGKSLAKVGKLVKASFAAAIVVGVANVSKEMILAASNAEETSQKFNVTFRDIQGAAEQTAQSMAANFGLSKTAAKGLLADTGDLLSGFGFTQSAALDLSTQVNELAVDLASFTNFSGGAAGASAALTKGLLGETDSMKALGIAILQSDIQQLAEDKGIVGELDRQTKAHLTMELALKQSQNSIGDFARSSDSFANQQRIAAAAVDDLKVAIGDNLLPIATNSISVFAGLTQKVAEFIEERNRLKEAQAADDAGTSTLEDEILLQEEQLSLSEAFYNAELNFLRTQGFKKETEQELIDMKIGQLSQLDTEINGSRESLKILRLKLQSQTAVNAAKNEEASQQEVLNALEATKAEKLATLIKQRKAITNTYEDEISAAEALYSTGVIDYADYTDAKLKAEQTFQESLVQLGYDGLADSKNQLDVGDQQLIDSLDRKAELIATGEEDLTEIYAEALNEREERRQELAEEQQEHEDEEIAAKEEAYANLYQGILSGASSLYSGMASLVSAQTDRELEALDTELQAALEAAGVQELSNVEQAEKALILAKETGDKDAVLLAENKLKKAKIEAEYEKKKAKLEYDGEKKAWEYKKLSAIASGALAIVNGFATQPFIPAGIAAGALATGLAGVQIATVKAQKPIAPSFADGGIVPGTSFVGDKVSANVNSGELLLNKEQQTELYNIAKGTRASGASNQRINATFLMYWDGKEVAQGVVDDFVNKGIYPINIKRGTR